MEIIHVQFSGAALAARRGPVEVSHDDTVLRRRLTPREEVVLTDLDGDFHSARVLMIDNAGVDPIYFLHLGRRLSLVEAARRLNEIDLHGALTQIGNALQY
ncbi:hypothetical protein [Nocardioides sp. CER19]|uniref:hypothetical protein n=1 Tax=Nocardioides sp. CER19 TaxID=3038538 RepID=UPI00244A8280|nr:hypothetical protein [Nocardioides sp. CER19]MDH2414561.1 hypothetical protein [Nocardioides sp. CER19]